MKRFAICLLAAALSACATPLVAPDALAPGPDGTDWIFSAEGDEGYLAFGTPESDDLRLGLRCRRGEADLEVTQIVPRGSRDEIALRAGGVTRRFPARSEPEQMSGGEFLTATVAGSDPVIAAFRASGRLDAVRPGGRSETFAPQPGTTTVADFFEWCG